MKDRLFQIWFSLRCGVANREFVPLLEQYGSPYAIFMADDAEIERLDCSDKLKRALCDKGLSESHRILAYCEREHVGVVFWQDADYPGRLRTLIDPPVLLYYRGHLPDFDRRLCVSVVGTRKMSEYGKRMAYKLSYEMAAVGTVIISGLALGVDGVAAAGAIASGGHTVAVMGCGIDMVYPTVHADLAAEISLCGAVITEFPPSMEPRKENFPIRNRIISGLGQGTVVIEADGRSGALITARTAILQGRDIYAVPGNVGDANTSGTNRLIHDGAAVVLRAKDILENYVFLYGDALRMHLLPVAERASDPDPTVFERLKVYHRDAGYPSNVSRKSSQPLSRESTRQKSAAHTSRPSEPFLSRQKDEIAPHAHPTPSVPAPGDRSPAILTSLNDTQRKLFELLPLDRAVTVDHLTREGFSTGEVVSAMTILEIKGLVVTLPGGLYSRK